MTDASRRLAAENLGLPPTAGALEARAAFLRLLSKEAFLPSGMALAAIARLAGDDPPMHADARAEEARLERADLVSFREVFWSLTPAEREARWQQLKERVHDQISLLQLHRIQPGLTLPVTPHNDPDVEELARQARVLFLLPPRERSIRRAEWLAEHGQDPRWRQAARTLQNSTPFSDLEAPTAVEVHTDEPFEWQSFSTPGIASLEPQLFQSVVTPTVESQNVPPIDSETRQWIDEGVARKAEQRERRRQRAEQRKYERANAEGSNWNLPNWAWGIIALIVLRGCLLIFKEPSKPSSTPSPPTNYRPNMPTYTADQIRRFESYDPTSGEPAPPGYNTWRLMGGKRAAP